MKVFVPTPLRSYTREESVVEGSGSSLGELLADMDRRYPGFRFRIIDEQDGIRQHIKIFVNQEQAGTLEASLRSTDEVHIICALSGGRGSDLRPPTSDLRPQTRRGLI
jgi:molybdopterin synthase sulfur carrier subunit